MEVNFAVTRQMPNYESLRLVKLARNMVLRLAWGVDRALALSTVFLITYAAAYFFIYSEI